MNAWPTTDPSLLAGIIDPQNHESWKAFDELYRPVVYRFARRSGAAHHDAEEIAADVMRRVARASSRWGANQPPERFAAWLTRVSQNSLINLVCRDLSRRGTGGTTHQLEMNARPMPTDQSREFWAEDCRREALRSAANRIRGEFEPDNWKAFWKTHVEGISISVVAKELGKTTGPLYALRSRIIRRWRLEVEKMSQQESES